jgi:SNF2 family DNA or RNA helicase
MLLPHQKKAIENFNGYTYLAWETGTGKTLTALKIAENFKNVLIICPASTTHSVWQSEIEKWNINLKNYKIISYDKFRKNHQSILNQTFWNFIILDEAHKLKNIHAKITRLIMKIFPKTYKIMLSGTPFEKPEDYYTQLRILRHDHPFSQLSYQQYKFSFFKLHNEYNYIIDFLSPEIKQAFLNKYVLPYVQFLRRDEIIELPSLIETNKYFNSKSYLPNATPLLQKLKESNNPLQTFMIAYQLAALQLEKIEYTCDFILDNKQTIVFSYFLNPLLEIVKRLGPQNVYLVHGQNKKDLQKAINLADKPLLATYCISEGINLNQYKNIIFLSLPLAWRTFEQALSRAWRFGQTSKVYLQRLIHGIDHYVWKILAKKGDVLEELKKLSTDKKREFDTKKFDTTEMKWLFDYKQEEHATLA